MSSLTECVLRVQVRDGSMSSSPLLGKYCGVAIPPMLQSTQSSMYIRFKTDASVNNFGFEAAYGSAIEGESYIARQLEQLLPILLSTGHEGIKGLYKASRFSLFHFFRLWGDPELSFGHHHHPCPSYQLPPWCKLHLVYQRRPGQPREVDL